MKITIDIKEMLWSSEEDVLEAIAERLKWGDNAPKTVASPSWAAAKT